MVSSMEVDTKNTENTVISNRKLNKTILDNFSNLIKPQEKIRIKSSLTLLKYLSENDAEKVNEVDYALGRIIRGLGSSNASARTGFYTILVATINFNSSISYDTIFNFIEKQLHKAGSNTKSENADIATGQILACAAIIRSRLWPTTTFEQKEKILSILIKAGKERTYLGLLANHFIVNCLEHFSEKKFQKILPLIQNEVVKPWVEQTIDTVYLLHALRLKYPNLIDQKFCMGNFGTRDLICEESLNQLCEILLTIPRLSSLKHPFYSIISKEIATSDLLYEFTEQLDTQLTTRNRNKLIAAIQIYMNILDFILKTAHIPSLLTKNFVQHTLSYFKNVRNDEDFRKIVHQFFDKLVTTVKKDGVKSKTKIAVLRKLLFFPGTFIFEKITKSKVIQLITASLDEDGVKNLATLYRGVVSGTEHIDSQDEHWLNNDRLYAAHLLVKMLNLPAVKDDNTWKVEQLCFLMNLGLFRDPDGCNVGSELAGSLKTAFYGGLDLKLPKLDDRVYILTKLFDHLNSRITKDNLETLLRSPISEETYYMFQKTVQSVTKIEKKRKGQAGLKTVFLTLFLQMGLELFNETKLATDSINELFACYKKSRKSRKDSVTSLDETTTEDDQNEPLWIEVVVDLFLNLLSHNSHLLRHMVNCVFPHLCQYMSVTAVHQILAVLDPHNEDNPLSKRGSESSDDEDFEDENEKTINSTNGEEDSATEDEAEEDSESEEEVDVKESVNDKLRMALQAALSQNGGSLTDEESVDLDDLSETEGNELDKALAAAFKQHKPNRGKQKKQSKDDETLTHFRIRVLDLIEIYINSTPSLDLSLQIMLPLLQAIEFSIRDNHQLPLHNRLKSCLKKLTNLKKFSGTEVDETQLCECLKSLLEKGTKTTWIVQDMRVEIAQCCIFIIKCSDIVISSETTSKKTKKKLKNALTDIISSELYSFFHNRDSLTPIVLFKNILSMSWEGCLALVPLMLEYIFDSEVKPFKKNQATELLKIFYLNQRYLNPNKDKITEALKDQHETFSDSLITFFTDLRGETHDGSVKEKFVCSLFNLLSTMKTCCLNLDNINWKKIGELVSEYRSHVTFSKDAKSSFNRLCQRLGVSHVVKQKTVKPTVPTKDKEEQTTEQQQKAVDGRKKSKKMKNKEKLKQKKEAKQMRLQSLSEGLGGMDFTETTNVDVEFEDNDESEDDVENQKQQKHKKRSIENGAEVSQNTRIVKKRRLSCK